MKAGSTAGRHYQLADLVEIAHEVRLRIRYS
jgi:hypothetical protein